MKKKCCTVSILLGLLISFTCAQPMEVAPGVLQLGTFQNGNIIESSGLAASRRTRGYFWTHNDGSTSSLFAFTTNGTAGGEYTVTGPDIDDWEDIAVSGGRIYIADIGNNNGNRDTVNVYYVYEPRANRSGTLRIRKQWTIGYPGKAFDAESFFVRSGYGYIISKELDGGEASLYRFRLGTRTSVTLQELGRLNVDFNPTGADLTADGRRLAVITDNGAYLFSIPRGRIPTTGQLEPTTFVPFTKAGMEGCAFTRSGLLVTAESGEIYLFNDPVFGVR